MGENFGVTIITKLGKLVTYITRVTYIILT